MLELRCLSCDVLLEGESFAGPPRAWFANEGVLSIVAARQGWKHQLCPTCQKDGADER